MSLTTDDFLGAMQLNHIQNSKSPRNGSYRKYLFTKPKSFILKISAVFLKCKAPAGADIPARVTEENGANDSFVLC